MGTIAICFRLRGTDVAEVLTTMSPDYLSLEEAWNNRPFLTMCVAHVFWHFATSNSNGNTDFFSSKWLLVSLFQKKTEKDKFVQKEQQMTICWVSASFVSWVSHLPPAFQNSLHSAFWHVSFLGFDFISNYGLDSSQRIPGVRRITGSNELQRAYKITRNADFRIPTRWCCLALLVCLGCLEGCCG